jgi:hypothetical protein
MQRQVNGAERELAHLGVRAIKDARAARIFSESSARVDRRAAS